ncbi:hypothetical protein HYH03_003280 [Edaphochlamys debaryana]|uniref:Uncharacterized protein n=1 Tax=Edaphochlamys debaryana TaxID=47281 RepID=A0A835YA26_9CHLO|nr:hypothetical protein HYH03_003280 [Edaphochlamys debaryana]|eukprot:KAG2499097.1 hypothetical protein HYH03_003280 [Edaphochlamys debaryana]
MEQNLQPFGPRALWEDAAGLRRYLAEAVNLPVPNDYAPLLFQQHGQLRGRLVALGDLPQESKAVSLAMKVAGVLVFKLGEGTETYTAALTQLAMEGMLLFISSYLTTVPFSTNRNAADRSGATVPQLRPDFLCWVRNVLIFKGEEKAGRQQMEDAVAELSAKMSDTWLEGLGPSSEQPPSMLAYAAAGRSMQFFSIRKRAGTVFATPISDVIDLDTIPGRVRALTAACNIWRLLAGFSSTGMTAAFALGATLRNPDGDRLVTLMPGFIRKSIFNFHKVQAPYTSFELLQKLYREMSTYDNPCVIIQARGGDGPAGPRLENDTYVVHLAPVGVPCSKPPETEADVARAVHGVLRGLAALHGKGYVHRDVRWDNVVYLPAERRWLLIDLEHAGVAGCDCSRPPFPLRHWSGRTLDSGGRYTAASDLRMVAEQLIGRGGRLGLEGRTLQQQLMEGTLTAEEAAEHNWFSEFATEQEAAVGGGASPAGAQVAAGGAGV